VGKGVRSPSLPLGFSPVALPLSLSGQCEKHDAAVREGDRTPFPNYDSVA
jgi:hypothetical protein